MIAPSYMLDTNVCIHIRKQRPAEILARFRTLKPGQAVISIITYGELRFGAERSTAREHFLAALESFITLVPAQPLPQSAGAQYGSIRSTLARRGEIIGNNDLWIAAHACAANLVLVTSNENEFRRVPGLVVENWTDAA